MQADVQRLREASDKVIDTSRDLSADWDRVTRQASELFGGAWTGHASSSYNEPWQECVDGFHRVIEGLGALGTLLAGAAGEFAAQDDSNMNNIRSTVPTRWLNL